MKLNLVSLNLYGERQGEGKCVGVGLQVLTKTVPLFLIPSITGHCPSGGAARPLNTSVPAHQAPASWSKVGNFGFIPFFTHVKVYLISGLLCFLVLVPQMLLEQVSTSPKLPLCCAFGTCKIQGDLHCSV